MTSSGAIKERLHTTSMYRWVLFSTAGAHARMIFAGVLRLYLRMYLRRMTKAARSPKRTETNCSNSLSVGLGTSPSHVFPIRMFSGLLFRIPLGVAIDSCQFLDVVI